MSIELSTIIYFVLIGLMVGWIYGVIAKDRGMKPRNGMIISAISAVGGGVIFSILDLGAVLVMSLMTSVFMLFVSHIMRKA